MIIPTNSTIAFRMSFWTAAIASLLSLLLIGILRYQRYRKRHQKFDQLVLSLQSNRYRLWNQLCSRISSIAIILPVYEPILWGLSLGFLIQASLLGAPGPYPNVPSWFLGASYNTADDTSSASVNTNNEGFRDGWYYFVYWFTFEVMSEGFGIVLLWKYPSKEVFLSSLKYAILYASMFAGITTLGFNWYLLGVNQNIQSILDSVFVGTPCILYSFLLIFDRCLRSSQRNSIRLYAVFALAWRLTSLIAIVTGSYSTLLGASITLFRSICMPLVMYTSLILETNYWRNLAGSTVRKLETFAVISPTDYSNNNRKNNNSNNGNTAVNSPTNGRYRSPSQYSTGSALSSSSKSRRKYRPRDFEREASFRDLLETSGVPMTRSSLYSRSSLYDRQKDLDDDDDNDNETSDSYNSTDKEQENIESSNNSPPVKEKHKISQRTKPRAFTSDGTLIIDTDPLTIKTNPTTHAIEGKTVKKHNRSASDYEVPKINENDHGSSDISEPKDTMEDPRSSSDDDNRPRTSGSIMVRRRRKEQENDGKRLNDDRYASPLAKIHKYIQQNKRLIAVSPGGVIKSVTDNNNNKIGGTLESPHVNGKKNKRKIREDLQIPEWGTLKNSMKQNQGPNNNSLGGAVARTETDLTSSDPSLGTTPPILLSPAANMIPIENNLLSFMFGGTITWFSRKKDNTLHNNARNKLLIQESMDPKHNGISVPSSLSGITVSTDEDSSRNTTPYSSKPSTRGTLMAASNPLGTAVSTPGIQLQPIDSSSTSSMVSITVGKEVETIAPMLQKNTTIKADKASSVWGWLFGPSSKGDKVPLLPSGTSSKSSSLSVAGVSYGTGTNKSSKQEYPSDDEQIDKATLIDVAKRMQRATKVNNNYDDYDDDNDDEIHLLQSAEGFFKQRAAEMLGPRRRQGLRNADIDTVAQFENDNSQYLVDFVDLEIGEYMDKGGTSLVYVGRYKGDSVAIKIFRPDRIDEHVIAFFHKENAISAAFVHPSIVRYYGLCVSPPTISLVFELCPRGSLYNLIDTLLEARREDEYDREHGFGDYAPGGKYHKERLEYIRQQQQLNKNMLMNNGRNGTMNIPSSTQPSIPPSNHYTLSWRRKLRMARDGAAALAYLHSFDPPYLHRDVKSQNFLITQDYHMKLSDFGESRVSSGRTGVPMTGEIGTTHWMAPEMLRGEAYTEAVDIYGFGIVLWEIATERHPYDNLPERQIVYAVSVRGVRPPIPNNCPPTYSKLIQACWDTNPNKRPSAEEVLAALESMNPPV